MLRLGAFGMTAFLIAFLTAHSSEPEKICVTIEKNQGNNPFGYSKDQHCDWQPGELLQIELFRRNEKLMQEQTSAIEKLIAAIKDQSLATKALDQRIEETSKKQYEEFPERACK